MDAPKNEVPESFYPELQVLRNVGINCAYEIFICSSIGRASSRSLSLAHWGPGESFERERARLAVAVAFVGLAQTDSCCLLAEEGGRNR